MPAAAVAAAAAVRHRRGLLAAGLACLALVVLVVLGVMIIALGGRAPPSEVPAGTGIPRVAMDEYLRAPKGRLVNGADPLEILAGIARVESHHAAGHTIDEDGTITPAILGPTLDGSGGTAAIADTDHGALDGDQRWDRPSVRFKFIPTSWTAYGADGNEDGRADPSNFYDASLGGRSPLRSRHDRPRRSCPAPHRPLRLQPEQRVRHRGDPLDHPLRPHRQRLPGRADYPDRRHRLGSRHQGRPVDRTRSRGAPSGGRGRWPQPERRRLARPRGADRPPRGALRRIGLRDLREAGQPVPTANGAPRIVEARARTCHRLHPRWSCDPAGHERRVGSWPTPLGSVSTTSPARRGTSASTARSEPRRRSSHC